MSDLYEEYEKIRTHLIEERDQEIEYLIEDLHEITSFSLGTYKGKFLAYDNKLEFVRRKLKYGIEEN